MLVLSRRVGDTIRIGEVASVVITGIHGQTVSMGISTRLSVELIHCRGWDLLNPAHDEDEKERHRNCVVSLNHFHEVCCFRTRASQRGCRSFVPSRR